MRFSAMSTSLKNFGDCMRVKKRLASLLVLSRAVPTSCLVLYPNNVLVPLGVAVPRCMIILPWFFLICFFTKSFWGRGLGMGVNR